jgi:hypothetical protein
MAFFKLEHLEIAAHDAIDVHTAEVYQSCDGLLTDCCSSFPLPLPKIG